ncbi:MAG: HEAT repeat domain-containing protein [Deltaproteobacteria bacterium]|nr:HEAT repeat domain-containing protein [Deltaproteobacteria bacterium]
MSTPLRSGDREPLLSRLFKIRPQEAQRVLLLFAYLLSAVGAFIMGRNARDTLFLSHFSRDVLVYMYISQAVVVALPAWGYARFTNHFRRDRLLIGTLLAFMVTALMWWALIQTGQGWVYIGLYNWVELVGALLMIQFWTFAGDVFSSREAKRIFPFIGGGGVLANILIGGMIIAVVKAVGVETLLLLMVALMTICLACVLKLGKIENTRLEEQARDRRRADDKKVRVATEAQGIFQSNHLKIIAMMTCITMIAVQFVDFQFKSVTRETFRGEELAAFYGYFTVATGVIAAAAQFGLSARVLENYGVVAALAVLPASLLLGNGWVVIAGGTLWAATFTQGAQTSFRYSIYDATMQVLYTPVPANVRGRAKNFIDGILKPASIGGAGIIMWLLGNKLGLAVGAMAWVGLALVIVWLGLVLSIKREYVRELMSTLRQRRLHFDQSKLTITDPGMVALLRTALEGPDPRAVRNALELVPRVTGESMAHSVMALLQHPAADIRARALTLLGETGTAAGAQGILNAFQDGDESVRAAAVRAYCLLGRERAIGTVGPLLEDTQAAVRAAAVAGMIAHGGLDGILRAALPLKHMLESESAVVREQAARVLMEIRVRNFYQPVLQLLRDASPRVQQAALAAAGEMQSPELVPALVYKLGSRETALAAGRALARYGEHVLDVLGKVLSHPNEDLAIRRQVPRILAQVGGRHALDLLLAHLEVSDPGLRREVARAAVRVRDRLGATTVAPEPVEAIIAREVEGTFQLLAALEDLGPRPTGPALLHDSLEERVAWAKDRIFRLLAIIHPSRTVDMIFGNLTSPSQNVRANAVEVLDNLCSKTVKRVLVPLVEETPPDAKLRAGAQLFRLERKGLEAWLQDLMTGADPWLRVCAVHEAGERRLTSLEADVEARLRDDDSVVREAAVQALARLVTRDRLRSALGALQDERVDRVRRFAQHVTAQPAA